MKPIDKPKPDADAGGDTIRGAAVDGCSLHRYINLRDDIDRLCEKLVIRHVRHLSCRAGCADCCTNIFVHAAEWRCIESILANLPSDVRSPESRNPPDRCQFLTDDTCSIYEQRPIICRVHGLPIRYPVREYDSDGKPAKSGEHRTLWCNLNFRGFDARFGPVESLDVDAIDMGAIENALAQIEPASSTAYLELNAL